MAILKLEIKNDFGNLVRFCSIGIKDVSKEPYDMKVLQYRIKQLAKSLEKDIKYLSTKESAGK